MMVAKYGNSQPNSKLVKGNNTGKRLAKFCPSSAVGKMIDLAKSSGGPTEGGVIILARIPGWGWGHRGGGG